MSEIKVDKISPQSGTALQIGDASDVITIPSGATITNSGTANGFGADTDLSNLSAATGYSKIAQAWVRVNAISGACDLNDSHGVSSVADSATGIFLVNFSSAMTSDYYVSAGCAATDVSAHNRSVGALFVSTSQAKVWVWRDHDNSSYDMNQVSVIFFCGDA